MKLYKIMLRHCSPKDSVEVVAKYVLADNDEQILRGLDSLQRGLWTDRSKYDGMCDVYDDKYNVVGEETYLEKMLRLRGEFYDENASYEEAYYGVTHYGWQEGVDMNGCPWSALLRLGVAEDWRCK